MKGTQRGKTAIRAVKYVSFAVGTFAALIDKLYTAKSPGGFLTSAGWITISLCVVGFGVALVSQLFEDRRLDSEEDLKQREASNIERQLNEERTRLQTQLGRMLNPLESSRIRIQFILPIDQHCFEGFMINGSGGVAVPLIEIKRRTHVHISESSESGRQLLRFLREVAFELVIYEDGGKPEIGKYLLEIIASPTGDEACPNFVYHPQIRAFSVKASFRGGIVTRSPHIVSWHDLEGQEIAVHRCYDPFHDFQNDLTYTISQIHLYSDSGLQAWCDGFRSDSYDQVGIFQMLNTVSDFAFFRRIVSEGRLANSCYRLVPQSPHNAFHNQMVDVLDSDQSVIAGSSSNAV